MANLWKKIKIRFNKYKTRLLTAVFAMVPSFSSELPHRELPEFKLAKEINLDLSADTMEEAFKKGKCADLMSFVEKKPAYKRYGCLELQKRKYAPLRRRLSAKGR